jgi:cytochrome b561
VSAKVDSRTVIIVLIVLLLALLISGFLTLGSPEISQWLLIGAFATFVAESGPHAPPPSQLFRDPVEPCWE